jgi:hypothetical protein
VRFAIAALILLATPASAQSRDQLRWPDYVLWAISTVFMIGDGLTTHDIAARSDEGYREANPFLSNTPSHGEVNRVVLATLIGNVLISRVNNKGLRRVMWAIVLGAEASALTANLGSGLHFRMAF